MKRLVLAGSSALLVVAFVDCVGSDPTTDAAVPDGSTPSEDGSIPTDDGSSTTDAEAGVALEGKLTWSAAFPTLEPANAVATDSSGNVVAVMTFGGSNVPFGPSHSLSAVGPSDVAVVKLSPAGTVLWARAISSPDSKTTLDVAVDANGDVYVSGAFVGPNLNVAGITIGADAGGSGFNGFVAKLAGGNGDGIWGFPLLVSGALSRQALCHSVAVNGTSVAFGCIFARTITYGGTSDSVANGDASVVGVLDATNGNMAWSQVLRGAPADTQNVRVYAIDVDATGNVYVGGSTSVPQMYTRTGAINNALRRGSIDGFAAKLTTGTGLPSWLRIFGHAGSSKNTELSALALDRTGGSIYVGGGFEVTDFGSGQITSSGGGTNNDAYVLKLATTGDTTWQKTFGNAGGERVNGLAIDPWGNPVAAGNMGSAGVVVDGKSFAAGDGFFVLKLDPATYVAQWVNGRTTGGDIFGLGVGMAPSGHTYVVGQFVGSVDFETTRVSASSGTLPSAYVAAFTP